MFANAKQHLPSVIGNYLGQAILSLHFCISALLPLISFSIKNPAIPRQMQHSPKLINYSSKYSMWLCVVSIVRGFSFFFFFAAWWNKWNADWLRFYAADEQVLIKTQTRNSYKTKNGSWDIMISFSIEQAYIKVIQVQVCCGCGWIFHSFYSFSWLKCSSRQHVLPNGAHRSFILKMGCSDESTQLLTGQEMQCGVSIPFPVPWV